ncbi:MAG: hypothetical protein AAGF97_13795 [Planctomycetota bacterium]
MNRRKHYQIVSAFAASVLLSGAVLVASWSGPISTPSRPTVTHKKKLRERSFPVVIGTLCLGLCGLIMQSPRATTSPTRG